jgi:capsular polysaccharide biosynthesis protein
MYEFSLKTFYNAIKTSKLRIATHCGIAVILGLVIAFSIPKEYTADKMLAPEQQQEGISGGLGNLANMAGLNLSNSTDAIVPDLYPSVVESNDFIVNLLYTDVTTIEGDTMTYLTYLREHTNSPWWSVIGKGLRKIIGFFTTSNEEANINSSARIDPTKMSRAEDDIVGFARSNISCSISQLNNTINISVRAQDPNVAKIMADEVTDNLQNFIILYRTSKVRGDYEYYKTIAETAYMKYLDAEKQYAQFCDSHSNATKQTYLSERDRLANDVQITLMSYTQMKQQEQMAEAKVRERTPAFTVIKQASVPNRHSSPRKVLILAGMLFLALSASIMHIYIRLLLSKGKSILSDIHQQYDTNITGQS